MFDQFSLQLYESLTRELEEFEEYKENNKQELIRLYTQEPDNLNNILLHTQFYLTNSRHIAHLTLQRIQVLQIIFEHR